MPPVAPMLAKPVGQLPDGPYSYEPKWDGFRTILCRLFEAVRCSALAVLVWVRLAAVRSEDGCRCGGLPPVSRAAA